MKKISFFLVSLLSSNLFSSDSIELKKGWSLIGINQKATIEELKLQNENIDEIFTYKGKYSNSGEINPSDGIWIKVQNDTSLNLSSNETIDETANRIDKITLKRGWNLISLPIETTILPRLFRDIKAIWKYKNNQWDSYISNENLGIDFLKNQDGFWINSNKDTILYLSDEEARLTNFASNEEMLEYLENMVTFNQRFGPKEPQKIYLQEYVWELDIIEDVGLTPPSASAPSPFDDFMPMPTTAPAPTSTNEESVKTATIEDITTTNLQEKEVDEADIVKHDGERIFYLPSDFDIKEVYVTTFERVLNKEYDYLTKIELEGKPTELYLINNRLILIYPRNNSFWEEWGSVDYELWSGKSRVEVYDVADLNNITKIEEYSIDGNIVSSRVTNSKLYLITRYMPYVNIYYPKIYINCDDGSKCLYHGEDVNGLFQYDYENYVIKDKHLIPTIIDTLNDKERDLISKDNFYAPLKINQEPFITTLTSFDIKDFSNQESISVVGDSKTIYASTNAIYSVSQEFPIFYARNSFKYRSAIYKLSIDEGLSYSGKTFIDGYILNQFSLSEYNDILRVASTISSSWGGDTDNIITTINEVNGNLNIFGKLEGLGLYREKIKAVRFIGDRGFVVTFVRTDPLYTIDLSDPANPKKVGELKISGYSSYFHPIDENRILSIGRDTTDGGSPKGVQIELFDISDFSSPKLADKVTIGTNAVFSEAETNHKAFTYRNSDNLFAFPINGNFEREPIEVNGEFYYPLNKWEYKSYLDIYQVDGLEIKSIDTIDTNSTQEEYNYQRSIIFTKDSKDYAIYIAGGEIYFKEIIK